MGLLFLDPTSVALFPEPSQIHPLEDGLVAIGGVLSPRAVLEAYRKGIFPWTGEHPIPWYSPDPRLILEPGAVKVRRSLRQRIRNGGWTLRFDQNFEAVVSMCATTPRRGQDGTWITPNMMATWSKLHHMGHAHSVEVYRERRLVGGLYGLALGGAFFGESMAAREPDASKVALVALCRHLEACGFALIDCQQETGHLKSMGAVAIPRRAYLERLSEALERPAWRAPDLA